MNIHPIAAILVALAVVFGILLGWQGRKLIGRLEALENSDRKRKLPARAQDGLEDAMAIANDIHFQNKDADMVIDTLINALVRSEIQRNYGDQRLAQLDRIIKIVRNDPYGYDPDQENRKKDTMSS